MPPATREEVAAAVAAALARPPSSSAQNAGLAEVTASQASLASEVDSLGARMDAVVGIVEDLALDPAASASMGEARGSLARSRARLLAIRARLGRLRAYEEGARLVGVEREGGVEMRDVGSDGKRL